MKRFVCAALYLLPFTAVDPAFACLVCFTGIEPPYLKGLQWAILTLLIILAFIFSGVIAFFINLWKRAKSISSGNYKI